VKRPTSSSSRASGTRAVFGFLSVAALPLLFGLGCQGALEGNFPAQSGTGNSSGSGGSSSSGGSTGTGGSTSSGGSSGSGGSSVGCDAQAMVLKPNCATMGCHKTAGDFPPDMSGSDLGSVLKSKSASILCAGMKYIDPANPTNSVLYKVIAGKDCDEQMPYGMPYEGDELTTKLACMADWLSKQ
jgi:hypothetical protein